MDCYEKKIGKNKIIRYITNNSNRTIQEYVLKDGKPIKNYSLSKYDDYGFNGHIYIKENDTYILDKVNSLSFDFSIDHPLYIPLLNLLNGDDELIIDDDYTNNLNKKYMIIKRKHDKIYLCFVNSLEEDELIYKFFVFIKNIMFDSRSKIDYMNKDTKDRLYLFFEEIDEVFKGEYHQLTLLEYLVNNFEISEEEIGKYKKDVKKYIKR